MKDRRNLDDMPPGASQTINEMVAVRGFDYSEAVQSSGGYIFAYGTVGFIDQLTGKAMEEHFCFTLEVGPQFQQHAVENCDEPLVRKLG